MKYKFIYYSHKIHPKVEKEYKQWYLLVDSLPSFNRFIDARAKELVRRYYNLKMRDKQYVGHLFNAEDIVIEIAMRNVLDRKSVVDDWKVLDSLLEGYFRIFLNEGKFIVNSNNAFRGIDSSFKVLKTIESLEMVFPGVSLKDIRISKWQGGRHFYAKIGNQDVVVGGVQKWNTEKEARYNAEKYFRQTQI